MNKTKRLSTSLLKIVLIVIIAITAKHIFEKYILYSPMIPENIRSIYFEYIVVVDAAIIVLVGLIIIQTLVEITRYASRHLSREAQHILVNISKIIGYTALAIAVLARVGVSPETLIASATFSGLVLGLGLSPILSNFFSGIIILGTGYVKPGKYIKISTSSIPLTFLASPAYKMFSRDQTIPYIRGVVLEIGLIYTKIISIDGELLKIPNSIILNNSVVAEDYEESKKVQVRYEFPVTCDPGLVLSKIRERLSNLMNPDSFEIYVEEQSDKNYYIVLVVATGPPTTKVREFRSRVLQEILSVHREVVKNNLCAQ